METSMITQSGILVIVEAESAKEFGCEVTLVEEQGHQPMAGQNVFFEGGRHVAYYVDVAVARRIAEVASGRVVEVVESRDEVGSLAVGAVVELGYDFV